MKKLLNFMMVLLMGVSVASGCKKAEEPKEMTLEDLNAMLNDKVNMDMNLANAVAVIPFNHINGPKNEWKFYALVNFEYPESTYVKYQVTFLSCTCRAARVNYWSTMYVELTTPRKLNNSKIQTLTFDLDGTGHYTAGFWGDSNPIMDEATGTQIIATYDDYIDARKITVTIGEDEDAIVYTLNYDENDVVTSLKGDGTTYEVEDNKVDIGPEYTVKYTSGVATSLTYNGEKFDVVDGKVTLDTVEYTLNVDTDDQSATYGKVLSITNGEDTYEVVNDKVIVVKDTWTLNYGDPIYVGKLKSLNEGSNVYNVTSNSVTIGTTNYTLTKNAAGEYDKLKEGTNEYNIVNNQVTVGSTTYTLTYETIEYGENQVVSSITNGSETINVDIAYNGLFKDLDGDGDVDGNYHPTIKYEFIEDLLVGKTKTQIDSYNVMDDMLTNGAMSEELFDEFTHASVSTNNILRILHATFKHHASRFYDAEGNRILN